MDHHLLKTPHTKHLEPHSNDLCYRVIVAIRLIPVYHRQIYLVFGVYNHSIDPV
jgi:hypothetical protein